MNKKAGSLASIDWRESRSSEHPIRVPSVIEAHSAVHFSEGEYSDVRSKKVLIR